MRKLLLAAVFCLLTSTAIMADPFVILPSGELAFTTSFTTQGVFNCTLCTSGSGTNSIVYGSGANTVTITFIGVNTTVLVGNELVPTVMGQIQVVTTGSGAEFPDNINPNVETLFFNLSVTQSSPTAGTQVRAFRSFGGGGAMFVTTFMSDWIQFPTGPNPPPFTYTNIVYTFHPFTILNTDGVVDVTADLGAVPEPASLLLLGSGLVLALLKKRSSRTDSPD